LTEAEAALPFMARALTSLRIISETCSLFSLSLFRGLIASIGGLPVSARSTSVAPSSVSPVRARSFSATLFTASITA
jgi:hypothetical protein